VYDLKDDKIVLKPLVISQQVREEIPKGVTITYENAPKMYYYDIHNETSREISFEEAQKLSLQKGPSSPDGYTVSHNNNYDSGFLGIFGSENRSSYVITKGKGKKILSGIVGDTLYYNSELNIIGWIK
jgi:hypothetical protein